MSASLARTGGGWSLVTPAALAPFGLPAAATGELLANRAALDQALQLDLGTQRNTVTGNSP